MLCYKSEGLMKEFYDDEKPSGEFAHLICAFYCDDFEISDFREI